MESESPESLAEKISDIFQSDAPYREKIVAVADLLRKWKRA